MTLAARSPLIAFFAGAASIAYGSITSLPRASPGQVVVTVFAGAALLLLGAVHLALLLAREPARADLMLEAASRRAARHGRFVTALLERISFAEVPVLRWGLFAALLLVAAFAVAVLAGDVYAWRHLAWAVPEGASRVVLR